MILFGLVVSTLLWANLTNRYVWIVLGVTLGFGADRLLRRLSQGHEADAMPASPASCASLHRGR